MTPPYYTDDQVTLYHGDCLEIDAWLSADVLVTDPPYGIGWTQELGGKQPHLRHKTTRVADVVVGDTSVDSRDRCLELWGGRPAVVFGSWRITRPPGVTALLIWHKAGQFSGPANCAFMTEHEEIYVLGHGDWRKSAPPLMSVIRTSEHRPQQARVNGGHPTSKPLPLMEKLRLRSVTAKLSLTGLLRAVSIFRKVRDCEHPAANWRHPENEPGMPDRQHPARSSKPG